MLEEGAAVEDIPQIIRASLNGEIHHRMAALLLGFWESLNFEEVYIVCEDAGLTSMIKEVDNKLGIKLTYLKVVNCKEALKKLKED
ncbi:MAG: hypothetical protein KGH64_03735 [Candidatus Micrarchaeota archaeon]|nr:hypothetical protein [Candidatus Micrarchaeota archaeon]MDE1859893.1 hypothetical protein [Candidatus Micrarchaeota archaeon]